MNDSAQGALYSPSGWSNVLVLFVVPLLIVNRKIRPKTACISLWARNPPYNGYEAHPWDPAFQITCRLSSICIYLPIPLSSHLPISIYLLHTSHDPDRNKVVCNKDGVKFPSQNRSCTPEIFPVQGQSTVVEREEDSVDQLGWNLLSEPWSWDPRSDKVQ